MQGQIDIPVESQTDRLADSWAGCLEQADRRTKEESVTHCHAGLAEIRTGD